MANGNGILRKDYKNDYGIRPDSITFPELEFHLGHVERVFTTRSDVTKYVGDKSNVPTDSSQVVIITPSKSELGYSKGKFPARPLLRGINDSIARGDAVLFTDVEGTIFYLGPLNISNNPNYTPDNTKNRTNKTTDDANGYSKLFPSLYVSKLIKARSDLDFPGQKNIPYDADGVLDSKYSDLVLEGRHRNSIRIGSRSKFPLITISNNRTNISSFETRNDGSHISMFSLGSLRDYFPTGPGNGLEPFILSCDTINATNSDYNAYPIASGNDGEEKAFNYDYGKVQPDKNEQNEFDQMIIFSDRITFDARENDLTVSAFRNINFGAGKNFTLTNKGFTVLESKNIYIGKSAKQRSQPMVLGDKLGEFLAVITSILQDAHALVQGVPVPLVDAGSIPLTTRINEVMRELSDEYNPQYDTENGIPLSDRSIGGPRFFSNHHFIESNRS